MAKTEQFTLLQLADLALKTPEPGAVNFNMLHTLLTTLITRIELGDIKVKYVAEDEDELRTAQAALKRHRKDDGGTEKDPVTTEEIKEKVKGWLPSMQEEADPEIQAVHQDPLQYLRDDYFLEEEPIKVMTEVWKATNLSRRVEATEIGMTQFAELIDNMLDRILILEDRLDLDSLNKMLEEISTVLERIKILEETSRLHSERIKESNEVRASEIDRLEVIIKELKKEQEESKSAIKLIQGDLDEKVAYKSDLTELKEEMSDELQTKIKDIKRLIREVEGSLVQKSDFEELVSRVEQLEDEKISRDELGRLLEPGFIDNFLDEQLNIRLELNELREKVIGLEGNLEELKKMIEDQVIKTMEEKFAEVHSILEAINAKLSLIDPDDINDSFALLEEQIETIKNDLGELKSAFEQLQKEVKTNFNKISNLTELLQRLEQVKMDKTKMNELLEKKADLDLIMGKLDRSEFAVVVGNLKNDLERLTIKVKINEEEMNEGFSDVQHELSLQMYKEDFIYCTEPIRNRIKALIYELKRVKEIALTHLFPDAPGIAKCISCNRGAHMAGAKYAGDANIVFDEDIPPGSHVQLAIDKHSEEASGMSVPTTNLDSIPFPPPDKPRERDPAQLPVLFATARPNIGLPQEKRRSTIDKQLATFFQKKAIRSIEGDYTLTKPQQRGVPFTTFQLTSPQNEEVLLKGTNKSIYKGTVSKGTKTSAEDQPKPTTVTTNTIDLSLVSLHVDNEPLEKPIPLVKGSQNVWLPSEKGYRKTRQTRKSRRMEEESRRIKKKNQNEPSTDQQ